MSSDPIEVLRDLRVGVEMDAAHDPQGPAKLAALDAALASLSAPKPPPMNDNAVAVNESATVNDKTESAEAVCPECKGKGWTPEAGVAFDDPVICPDCAGSGRAEHSITANESAPPRPEASAPVGVEWVVPEGQFPANVEVDGSGRAVLVSYGKGHPSGRYVLAQQPAPVVPVGVDGLRRLVEKLAAHVRPTCCELWEEAQAALAQQPAAVDGAMVERVTNAVVGWATLPGDLPAEPEKVAELREVISTAIAGQQQGGPQE